MLFNSLSYNLFLNYLTRYIANNTMDEAFKQIEKHKEIPIDQYQEIAFTTLGDRYTIATRLVNKLLDNKTGTTVLLDDYYTTIAETTTIDEIIERDDKLKELRDQLLISLRGFKTVLKEFLKITETKD